MKLRVNLNLTIPKTNEFTEDEKETALSASEGKVKAIKVDLIDSKGNNLVLLGKMYVSKNGNLTARTSFTTKNFEVVEIEGDKKTEDKKINASQMRAKLGLDQV